MIFLREGGTVWRIFAALSLNFLWKYENVHDNELGAFFMAPQEELKLRNEEPEAFRRKS
jgi:hypothetical protein